MLWGQIVSMDRELPGFTLALRDGRRECLIKSFKVLLYKGFLSRRQPFCLSSQLPVASAVIN